ncbi:MAG: ribonuclease D [Gammaproteobacteria bacterium]|nr:ribonuclease D [Gammaproteobacteria bacterium]
MIPTLEFIATEDALALAGARLAQSPWLAIDTEFMRVSTYYPELCLVQVATATELLCIDTLALPEPVPLLRLLEDPGREKLIHAGRQDLEVLLLLAGIVPAPVFDTQIAAALLGHPDQVSYAWLVEKFCGVALDKSQTRTDWKRRPLSPEQVRYAAMDCWYLSAVAGVLKEELAANGKLGWCEEECARLVRPAAYRAEPELAWQRVKGIGQLTPGQFPAAMRLAAWRERLAQAANRPRGWILKDDVLLALVREGPTTRAAVAGLPGMPPAFARRHADAVLELLHAATAPAAVDLGALPRRLAPEEAKIVERLMAGVQERATALAVVAPLIASRKDLEAAVRGRRDLRIFEGWRAEVLGEVLRAELPPAGDQR